MGAFATSNQIGVTEITGSGTAGEVAVFTSAQGIGNPATLFTSYATGFGIGTAAAIDPSVIFGVVSVSQGIHAPRMTTAQRTAIVSPLEGLMTYDLTSNALSVYNGMTWGFVPTAASSGTALINNLGIATATTLIGSTATTTGLTIRSTSGNSVGAPGADIKFQVGNNGSIEAMRILNTGLIGINKANPSYGLDAISTLRVDSNGLGTDFYMEGSASYANFRSSTDTSLLEIICGSTNQLKISMTRSSQALALTGNITISQSTQTTGALKMFSATSSLNSNQTLSTEINNILFTTVGRQWATGAIALQREFLISAPTYSFVGASTITDAVNLGVTAPVAGTNATFTRSWAAQFTGNLAVSGNTYHGGLTTAPTAIVHIAAGSTGTAPLRLTSGTLTTGGNILAGNVEFLTDDYFATITTGTARKGFVLTDGPNLVSGNVPYASTNGRLISSTGLTYNGLLLESFGSATNGAISIQSRNTNTGGSAYAILNVSNGTSAGNLYITGTGYTPSGNIRPNTTLLTTNGTGGIVVYNSSNDPNANIYFYTSAVESWRISSTGKLSNTGALGTASLHLAGGTAAVGSAPLKFSQGGVLLTVKEPGALEYVNGFVTLQSDALSLYGSANNRAVNNKILFGSTTDAATAVVLTTDGLAVSGATNSILVPTGANLSVVVNISVKQTGSANGKQMLRQFVISNNAGTVAIQGAVTTLGTDVGSDGLTAVTTTITADNTNKVIAIAVNGVAATNLRYSAYVVSTEVIYT